MEDLIGRGRDCDVYDLGDGRVRRHNRRGRSTEAEAAVMRHASAHGFAVPRVDDASGPDIVMERIDGPTMLDAIANGPWTIRRHARLLAALVERLAEVPAPEPTPNGDVPPGPVLVHLDLHPQNVIITATGPMVIDWTNASSGAPGVDAANTWLTIASARVDGPRHQRVAAAIGRRWFVATYLRAIDTDRARRHLTDALAFRQRDANLSADEVAAMSAIVEREAGA